MLLRAAWQRPVQSIANINSLFHEGLWSPEGNKYMQHWLLFIISVCRPFFILYPYTLLYFFIMFLGNITALFMRYYIFQITSNNCNTIPCRKSCFGQPSCSFSASRYFVNIIWNIFFFFFFELFRLRSKASLTRKHCCLGSFFSFSQTQSLCYLIYATVGERSLPGVYPKPSRQDYTCDHPTRRL